MIIFNRTYENIKTINCNIPIEDSFYAECNVAIVADGITRDPIGITDLSKSSFAEMIKQYPRPSGASIAAQTVSKVFEKYRDEIIKKHLTLYDALLVANKEIKIINDKYVNICDYLQNDYYGTVASCVYLEDNLLHYSYICDCGVIVFDKNGNIKFQTEDDKVKVDPYIDKIGIPWNLPQARVIVRRDFRNNINNIIDNICASYGALTGEEDAKHFIRSNTITINDEDIIIVYSDGFTNYFSRDDFFRQIKELLNENIELFNTYVEQVANSDYAQYGKEKTIIIMKK